jgi:anti-anti-sigma factor
MLLQIVEREVSPELSVVELTGRLALGRESQRIESLVEDLIKKSIRKVIFDLSGVDYIDSAGIGIIALASGKLRESGGTLSLVAPQGRALQLINLTQMNLIVKVYPTLDEAKAAA